MNFTKLIVKTIKVIVVIVILIGACVALAPSSDTDDDSTDIETEEPTEEPTEEETPTPTEVPEETEAPTETVTEEPPDIPEETEGEDREFTDEELLTMFELTVKEEVYQVESVSETPSAMFFEYRSDAVTEEAMVGEIGYISGAYAFMVNEGYDKRLIVDIYETDGSHAGEYFIEPEWAQDYFDGEITAEEYFTKIAETIGVS